MKEVLIDIKTCELSMSQLIAELNRMQDADPEHEYFMDGDLYAIVRKKVRHKVRV